MKDAAIIFSAILMGIWLVSLLVTILPFLIALGFIILIKWMIVTSLVGGFSPWRK